MALSAPHIQLRDGTAFASPLPEPLERAVTEADLQAAFGWYKNLEVHAHAGNLVNPQRTLAVASAYVTKLETSFGTPVVSNEQILKAVEDVMTAMNSGFERINARIDSLQADIQNLRTNVQTQGQPGTAS